MEVDLSVVSMIHLSDFENAILEVQMLILLVIFTAYSVLMRRLHLYSVTRQARQEDLSQHKIQSQMENE